MIVTDFYCVNWKMMLLEKGIVLLLQAREALPRNILLTSQITQKKQEFICNLRNGVFLQLNLQKAKISLRLSTDTFTSMLNTCRWRSVSCCWDMQWQFCAWLRESRVTTWCQKAGLHKVHLFCGGIADKSVCVQQIACYKLRQQYTVNELVWLYRATVKKKKFPLPKFEKNNPFSLST